MDKRIGTVEKGDIVYLYENYGVVINENFINPYILEPHRRVGIMVLWIRQLGVQDKKYAEFLSYYNMNWNVLRLENDQ